MKPFQVTMMLAGGLLLGILGAGRQAQGADWDDERALRAFDTLDTNRNGRLSLAEFRAGVQSDEQEKSDSMFARIDANNDGGVSATELRTRWDKANNILREDVYQLNPIAQARVMEAAFVSLDTDDSQFLSAEEFRAGVKAGEGRAAKEFRRTDDNSDSRLSRAEFNEDWGRFRRTLKSDVLYPTRVPESIGRSERQEMAFIALDHDNDGRITLAEYRGGLANDERDEAEECFASIDANDDNLLTRAEFYQDWDDIRVTLRPDLYDESSTVYGVERIETRTTTTRIEERVRGESEMFNALDTNDDGRLTQRELQSGVRVTSTLSARKFRQMDSNDDGYVSRDEFDADWIEDHRDANDD